METNFKWLVYKTTNKKNGKYYIGISYEDPNNIDKNFLGSGIYKNDPYTYQYSKTPLQWAVKTDGVDNFDRIIIGIADQLEPIWCVYENLTGNYVNQNRNLYNNFILMNSLPSDTFTKYNIFDANGGNWIEEIIPYNFKYWFEIIESALTGCSFKYNNKYCYAIKSDLISNKNNEIKYDHCRKQYIQNRPVFKYNGKTGEFIEAYNTQTEAEKANKYSNITKSIKLKTPDKNGFIWAIFKTGYYNIPDEKTIKLIERRERNKIKFAASKARRRERLGLKPRKN